MKDIFRGFLNFSENLCELITANGLTSSFPCGHF